MSTLSISNAGAITDIVWQHASTGTRLVDNGGMVALLNADGYNLTEFMGPAALAEYNGVQTEEYPPDATGSELLHEDWKYRYVDPPGDWLTAMLTHQVLMHKGCYLNFPIETESEYNAQVTGLLTVRTAADANPTKLFIIMTSPPITEYYAVSEAVDLRPRTLANWMVSTLSDGRDNLVVVDLFDVMADEDNFLHNGWEEAEDNPHINVTGCLVVGPQLADLIDTAIKNWRAV